MTDINKDPDFAKALKITGTLTTIASTISVLSGGWGVFAFFVGIAIFVVGRFFE